MTVSDQGSITPILNQLRRLARESGRTVITVPGALFGLSEFERDALRFTVVDEGDVLSSIGSRVDIVLLGYRYSVYSAAVTSTTRYFPDGELKQQIADQGVIVASVDFVEWHADARLGRYPEGAVERALAMDEKGTGIFRGSSILLSGPGWLPRSLDMRDLEEGRIPDPWLDAGATDDEIEREMAWRQPTMTFESAGEETALVELPDGTIGVVSADGGRSQYTNELSALLQHLPVSGLVTVTLHEMDDRDFIGLLRMWAQSVTTSDDFVIDALGEKTTLVSIDGSICFVPAALEGLAPFSSLPHLEELWTFDAHWNTGAPVSFDYHEVLTRSGMVYYLLSSHNGETSAVRVGLFHDFDLAFESAMELSEADHYRELERRFPDHS